MHFWSSRSQPLKAPVRFDSAIHHARSAYPLARVVLQAQARSAAVRLSPKVNSRYCFFRTWRITTPPGAGNG